MGKGKRAAGMARDGGGADEGRLPRRKAKVYHHMHPMSKRLRPIEEEVAQALLVARLALQNAEALHAQVEAQGAMTGAMSSPAVTLDQEKVDEDCVFVKSLTRQERDEIGRKNAIVIE